MRKTPYKIAYIFMGLGTGAFAQAILQMQKIIFTVENLCSIGGIFLIIAIAAAIDKK